MAKAVLKAKTTMDNRGFKVGMAQNQQAVKRFAGGQIKQIAGLIGGAFAVGAVVNFARELLSTADALDNAAKQMNIGVEELQALRRETELTAGSADKMDSSLRKLTKSMGNAVAGESEQVQGFRDLGISMEQVQTLSVDQLFEKIAIKVSGASLASKEASGASKILGRAYVELNTVMQTVADVGLENLKNKMLETNQIMSEGSVLAADAMEESFNRKLKSMTNKLREFVVNAITARNELWAYWGARSGGATDQEASLIAFQQEDPLFNAQTKTDERERKNASLSPSLIDKVKAPAATSNAVSAVTAADSIAKIGGILGGQTSQQTQEQTLSRSLRVQNESKAMLDEIKKNTAPIREG